MSSAKNLYAVIVLSEGKHTISISSDGLFFQRWHTFSKSFTKRKIIQNYKFLIYHDSSRFFFTVYLLEIETLLIYRN